MSNLATWGPFVFGVSSQKILTFHSYTRRASYKTELGEDGKNKPKTIHKGPDLGTFSMTVQLIKALGADPEAVSDEWIAACDAGTPYPLTKGGKRVGKGKWQLKDVTLNNTEHGKDGELVKADLVLNFIEYAGEGSKKSADKKPPKTNNTKPSSTVKPSTTDNTDGPPRTAAWGAYNLD